MAIENSLDIGQAVRIVEVSHDPEAVATDVVAGSIIVDQNGTLFRKLDTGPTTNVTLIGFELGVGLDRVGTTVSVDATNDEFTADIVAGGLAAQTVRSENEESTTSQTFITKAQLITPIDLFGEFWIEFTIESSNNTSGKQTEVKLIETTEDHTHALVQTNGSDFVSSSGFDVVDMDGISKTFELQYRRVGTGGGNTANVRRGRIRFLRKSSGVVSSSSSGP